MTLYFVQSLQSARKGSVFKLWYPPGTYTINRFLEHCQFVDISYKMFSSVYMYNHQ